MLTVEKLRDYGADVDEGIRRCMDDKDFYVSLVEMAIPDTKLDELETELAAKDYGRAFETAHALKGLYANIAVTPVLKPVSEITELLRNRTDTDYSALIAEAKLQKKRLNDLAAD